MSKYDRLTTEAFDELLAEIVNDEWASSLLQIPGIYAICSEHFNNDVLELWESRASRCELCGKLTPEGDLGTEPNTDSHVCVDCSVAMAIGFLFRTIGLFATRREGTYRCL